MTVHVHFRHPFLGLVFSHAQNGRQRCVHLGPGEGVTSASFDIRYDGCGTREDSGGRFHENTLVVQFDPEILEAWDEAKRLRCEWLESFEKKSSSGLHPLSIADLDVVELNFQGDDIDCWMEVQEGKGPWSRRVEGLVPVGSPLTLVIAIDDPSRQFDMRVKRCTASSSGDGNLHTELQLTDSHGCVSRPTLLTPFAKVREHGSGRATLVAYSHLHAFKFPDQMDVYVHCVVEVCRHGCEETCDRHATQESRKILSGLSPNHVFPGREKNRQQSVVDLQQKTLKSRPQSVDLHQKAFSSRPQSVDFSQKSFTSRPQAVDLPQKTFTSRPQSVDHVSSGLPNPLKSDNVFPGREKNRQPSVDLHQKTFTSRPQSTFPLQKSNPASKGVTQEVASSHQQNTFVDSKQSGQQISHRIVGHDAHWIQQNEPQPLPEPSSADHAGHSLDREIDDIDIRHKTRQDIDEAYHAKKPYVTKMQWTSQSHAPVPQPEPSAWTYDEVSVRPNHLSQPKSVPWTQPNLSQPESVPQPEPAAWTYDEVNPKHSPVAVSVRPNHLSQPKSVPWNRPNLSQPESVPQPEPAAWSYDEVNPMHSPVAVRPNHLSQPKSVPPYLSQPESVPWTQSELTDKELRLISLNHKMKSQAIDYRDVFASPQPVYNLPSAPRPSVPPLSNATMMMMPMSKMTTLLPPTYQTAHWQRPGPRYPYPVPQFSPYQQRLMAGIVADRRSDHDQPEPTHSNNMDSHQREPTHPSNHPEADSRIIRIGETAQFPKSATTSESELSDVTAAVHSGSRPVVSEFVPHPDNRADPDHQREPTYPEADSRSVRIGETAHLPKSDATTSESLATVHSGSRPAVSEFVPPSLDPPMSVADLDSIPISRSKRSVDATTSESELSESMAAVHSGSRPVVTEFDPPMGSRRRKRSSEPVFSVRQVFRVVAPSDLAFEWRNATSVVVRGRRADDAAGVCVSPAGIGASVGCVFAFTLLSAVASVVLYEHGCRLSRKTSRLRHLIAAGSLEALCRVTRPYLYPEVQ